MLKRLQITQVAISYVASFSDNEFLLVFLGIGIPAEAQEQVDRTTYIHSIVTTTGAEHTHDDSDRF